MHDYILYRLLMTQFRCRMLAKGRTVFPALALRSMGPILALVWTLARISWPAPGGCGVQHNVLRAARRVQQKQSQAVSVRKRTESEGRPQYTKL